MSDDQMDQFRRDIQRDFDRHVLRPMRAVAIAMLAAGATLLFVSKCDARDLAYIPNQAGGEIVLTTAASPGCSKGQMLAYSRGPDGATITGCWLAGENYVLIRWSATGAIKTFRYEDFQPLPRPMLNQAPQPDMRL